MKYLIVVAAFLTLSQSAYSQDYLKKIAENSCECMQKIPENLDKQTTTMKLGLCMIEAAMPYEKQLKKDYDINMSRIDEEGEKLGRIIGLQVATVCPDLLMKLTQQVGAVEEAAEAEREDIWSVYGEVVSVDIEQFVVFSVKENDGRTTKIYWLEFINSNASLESDYKNLEGKKVEFEYIIKEMFDPRIGEYRDINMATSVSIY